MMSKKILTCVESFAGAGGMALGLKKAGFKVLLAIDNNAASVETYNKNLEPVAECADIREVTAKSILARLKLKRGDLDLFSGGPPCQGFSKQRRGAHLLEDPRNALVAHYVKLVDGLQPKFFVLENVAVFGQKRGEKYLAELSHALHEKYFFYPNFYNSADFGLAQTRQRFVLVGQRKDVAGHFVCPKAQVSKWNTVGKAIGDLPEPPNDYTDHPQFPNHQRARVTQKNIERFSYVPQGGGWQDIPWNLRLDCHKVVDPKSGGWPDVYGRLKWDGQCPTITGGFDSFTRGRYGHPKYDRPLTPREAARLQGFPDRFAFVGSRQEVRTQIGNAVPPPLATSLGLAIEAVLTGKKGASRKALKRDVGVSGDQLDLAM